MSGRCDDEEADMTAAYLWGKADANDQIKRLTLMVEARDLVIKTERAKNERLREVVRFYACECSDAEACETFGDHDRSACGYKARAALGEET